MCERPFMQSCRRLSSDPGKKFQSIRCCRVWNGRTRGELLLHTTNTISDHFAVRRKQVSADTDSWFRIVSGIISPGLCSYSAPRIPDRGPECCDDRYVAPLSRVALRAYLQNYTCPIFTNFLLVTYCRGSVPVWRCCDTLCTSGFTDDVIFVHNGQE